MSTGTLYLCATPIGNMEDITYRAVRVMGEADLIAAEDTRHTRKLLAHYDIHTPLVSYHEHNKLTQGAKLIQRLIDGINIVCVSDAGMPGIADPGSDLVRLALNAGIRVTPLPGANAALSALICSGLSTTGFTFVGFLPNKPKKRRELLQRLAKAPETMIFYEAPHRLAATLADMAENMGAYRQAVLARELTKKFEEFSAKTLGEHCQEIQRIEPRGEYVIVVAGLDKNADEATTGRVTLATKQDIAETYQKMIAEGSDNKSARRDTARLLNVSQREVYKAVLDTRRHICDST